MKKNYLLKADELNLGFLIKLFRIMKISVFLLFICIFQVFADDSYSQTARLTLSMSDATVEQVLGEIEAQSEFYILYNHQLVDVSRRVDIEVSNKNIKNILNALFEDTDIDHLVMGRQIILSPKNILDEGVAKVRQPQEIVVTGKVTDEDGNPLPGVNIIIKGTITGTITDLNGNFSIEVEDPDAVLVFTFIGMLTQEIKVGNQTEINITMAQDIIGLEEVVAIGYGTSSKRDLTGSIVSVDMEEKTSAANVDLTQALQGYFPGINVGGVSRAGESASLSIRGQTSLSASDEPLIVLDGIIYNGNISNININDIEKIDVLKDASAAAVYGSRSANGVVIITTKRGKSEKPTFEFSMYYGLQDLTNTNRINIMDGEQFAVRMVDYYYQQSLYSWYSSNPPDATGRPVRPDVTDRNLAAQSLRSLEEQENYLAGNEIDWLDEVTQLAPIQNYNLNVSGATDRTNYFLSTSYTNQKGIMLNDEFDRITLRANFENSITDWLKIGLNSSVSRLDYSGLEVDIGNALSASPWANMYDENGNYPLDLAGESVQRHPLRNTLVDDVEVEDNVFLVLYAKVDIPKINGLNYEINYSNTFNALKHNTFYPPTVFEGKDNNGVAEKLHGEERGWFLNNILSYSKTFAELHRVNATLLYSTESRTGESSSSSANGFQNYTLGYNAMHLGENQSSSSGAWEENSISYMARASYMYNNRYMLTATYRRDGFSGFGANNKYADFPSVSLGWVASEENFLSNAGWLDFLKLRVSYGLNGNQGIGRYSSYSKMTSSDYVFGSVTAIGIYPEILGNNELGWETTASANIGLDFTFLDRRISGVVDIYNANTSNVLVQRTAPPASGYGSVWSNIGEIHNKGIEVSFSTVNVKSSSLVWNSGLLFSINRDEITKLYGGETDADIGNEWFVGHPINAHYNYIVEGVWQEEDLFNGVLHDRYYPGHYKLKDINENGDIHADDDRDIVGYATPNYRFGINNSITYKNITLSFFINSIQGGNGYYMDDNYSSVVAGGTDAAYRKNQTAIRPYWRPDNPVNDAPGMYYSPRRSHDVYEERSFVRLQDVSLNYDFNKPFINKIGLNSLQFYVSGRNLYTWTKWSGWDPEVYDNVPMMRSVIGGFRMSF